MVLLKKVWKDSATLIICGRNANNAVENGFNYKILAMKRSSHARFLPNMIAFPGGTTETVDGQHKWMQFFNAAGIDKRQLDGLQPQQLKRPFIYGREHWIHKTTDQKSEAEEIERDVLLRLTAIRETFEEMGLLIGRRPPSDNNATDLVEAATFPNLVPTQNVAHWQKIVHDDPDNFRQLCTENNVVPDVWSLFEWSNWLTPTLRNSNRRYDTAFYLVALHSQPTVLAEKSEVEEYLWLSPNEIFKTQQIHIPQIYEIGRLNHITNIDLLIEFAKQRGKRGMTLFYPIHYILKDGETFILPGDDAYPKEPDFVGKTTEHSHMTLEEFRRESKRQHRVETRQHSVQMFLNIEPPNGHLPPGSRPYLSPVPVARL